MMRSIWPIAVIVVVFLAAAACAGKVTTDPNAGPAKKALATPGDVRIAKKITYSSGYTRLHYVAEDLTRQTGVVIRCGEGKDDWHTRDIPVVVCAHDITLNRLMQAIADATHTVLTCNNVGGVRSYKLWKNPKLQKLFEKCTNAKREFAKAEDQYTWDNVARMSEVPDSAFEFTNDQEHWEGVLKDARDTIPILNYLGKDGFEKIQSGQSITLTVDNAPESLREPILRMGRRAWDKCAERRRELAVDFPDKSAQLGDLPGQDIEGTYVLFFMVDMDPPALASGACVAVDHGEKSWLEVGSSSGMYDFQDLLEKAKPGTFPKPPKRPDVMGAAMGVQATELHNLRGLQKRASWDLPFLQTKIKLEKPKDKTDVPFADAVKAIADAGGITIVCEDFLSHVYTEEYGSVFGSESTAADLLRGMYRIKWFGDPDSKLIVGWSGGWITNHSELVPESVLSNLTKKLDHEGVELDDFTPVSHWTFSQQCEWVSEDRWLGPFTFARFGTPEKGIWEVYDLLSSEDKALAKSESGLPLGKLDGDMLSAKFKEFNGRWAGGTRLAFKDNAKSREKWVLPTDPDAISHLTLKVIKRVPDTAFLPDPNNRKAGGRHVVVTKDFGKHEYSIEISGDVNGQEVHVEITGPGAYFPAYSPAREVEIENGKKGHDAKKKP